MKRYLGLGLLFTLFAGMGQLLPATQFNKLATYIQKGQVQKLESAVNKSNVGIEGELGETLLHRAVVAKLNPVRMTKALIEKGANVNAQTQDGIAPLHLAVIHGRIRVVETLLANKANAKLAAKGGVTPLHLATAISFFTEGIKAVRKQLKRGKELVTTMEIADLNTMTAGILLYVVGGGAIVPLVVGAWFTVFMPIGTGLVGAAASNIALSLLPQILGALVAVDIAVRNAIVKKLIDRGAMPNARDEKGNTPLHILAAGRLLKPGDRRGGLLMAKHLIRRGANVKIKNNAWKTPFDLAKEFKRLLIMPVLAVKRAERRTKRREKVGEVFAH